MAEAGSPMAQQTIDLGSGLELRYVRFSDLHEQDLNAQVMQPAEFERLVENIRTRGALESIPYAAQPPGQRYAEIVSGHHRVRAAIVAGISEGWVMVDTSPLTRSQITAKQIAHNQLVGRSDEAILRQLLERIDNVDDLLETGLQADMLPGPDIDHTALNTPHADFEWRTVTLTFLPHQMDSFTELVARLDGQQDMVGVAPVELFDAFARALMAFQRFKDVRSVGTAVAILTRMALEAVAAGQETDET